MPTHTDAADTALAAEIRRASATPPPRSLHALADAIGRVLGESPYSYSPEHLYLVLRDRGHRALADELEAQVIMPRPTRPPAVYDPAQNRRVDPVRVFDPYVPLNVRPPQYVGLDLATVYDTPDTRPAPPVPTAVTSIGEAAPMDAEYAALVGELGLDRGPADLEAFRALVPQLGLHVYDRPQVQAYLHHAYKVPPHLQTTYVLWGWRPLRAKDRTAVGTNSHNGEIQRGTAPYAKPIPYPVLLTVKAVRDACPSAGFFVSDNMEGEQIPDPFLLTVIGGQEFVIERWDEPAFRIVTK